MFIKMSAGVCFSAFKFAGPGGWFCKLKFVHTVLPQVPASFNAVCLVRAQ